MKPCIWSKRKFEKDGTEWFRGGDNITYKQNEISRSEHEVHPPRVFKGNQFQPMNTHNYWLLQNNGAGEGVDNYYTFSFTYEFAANQDDELWFAHAIPYTYTRMNEKIVELREKYGLGLKYPIAAQAQPEEGEEQEKSEANQTLKVNLLCNSLGRLPVPLLTITENV